MRWLAPGPRWPRQVRRRARVHADIVKLLGSITRIEYCWAYPGPRLLAAIGEALERRDPAGFARLVQKVSRALLTSDFRRDSLAWDVSGEAASPGLNTLPPDLEATATHKPYFEVLIVTPTDSATWERARDDLRRMRRPEDPFNYEVVQVGSFEDAALAVMVNDTLQAVVIIDGFQFGSRHELPDLQAFLARHIKIDTSSVAPGRAGHRARQGDQGLPARARPLPVVRSFGREHCGQRRDGAGASHVPSHRGADGDAPVHPRRSEGPLRDAVFRQPEALRAAPDRHLPRAAHRARQIRVQLQLDPRLRRTSTARTYSSPSRPRPPAASTACLSPPATSRRHRRPSPGPLAPSAPTSAPTARRPRTRSSCRRSASPATSSSSTAIATSRTTTASCSRGLSPTTSRLIR